MSFNNKYTTPETKEDTKEVTGVIDAADKIIDVAKVAEDELKPFSLEDGKDEKFCITCEFADDCSIIRNVNKMEARRASKLGKAVRTLEAEFGCTIYKEDES